MLKIKLPKYSTAQKIYSKIASSIPRLWQGAIYLGVPLIKNLKL